MEIRDVNVDNSSSKEAAVLKAVIK